MTGREGGREGAQKEKEEKKKRTHTLNSSHRRTLILHFLAGTNLGERGRSILFDPKTKTGIWFFSSWQRQIHFRILSPHPAASLILFMQETLTGKSCCVSPKVSYVSPPSLHAPVDICTQTNKGGNFKV